MSGSKSTDPFEDWKRDHAEEQALDRPDKPVEHLGRISDYFNPTPERPPTPESSSASGSAVRRLEALTRLLIAKGMISEQELITMLEALDRADPAEDA